MSMQEIFARFASASSRIILHRTRLWQWMLNIVMNKALSPKIIAANQLMSGNSRNSVANKNWSQYTMWIIWVSRTHACFFFKDNKFWQTTHINWICFCKLWIIECSYGFFGINCSETCNDNCKNNTTCDPINGVCLNGCEDGYIGTHCNNCKTYFFYVPIFFILINSLVDNE